jgi:hypothetical protein
VLTASQPWKQIYTDHRTIHSQARHGYPSPRDSRLLGLCTGALAAAAVSCARDVVELLALAVDSVLVAFRTGVSAASAGKRVTRTDQSNSQSGISRSWSLVAAGQAASQAVEDFGERSVRNTTTVFFHFDSPADRT